MTSTWRTRCAGLALLLALVPAAQAELTEASVLAFVAAFDAAIEARDLATIREGLADDAYVSVSIIAPGGFRAADGMNKREYLEATRDGWAISSDYSYRTGEPRIRTDGDTAILRRQLTESGIVAGQYLSIRGDETIVIELRGGEPRITQVTFHGNL